MLDNAPGKMHDLGLAHLNMEVEHLSKTNTPLLQLLSEGIFTNSTVVIFAAPSKVTWIQVRR